MPYQNPITPMSPTPSGGGGVAYYATDADFPASGDLKVLYIATDTKNQYQWDGVGYVLVTSNSDYISHINDTLNPHNVTKDQIGLSDVDNTSDADKPLSNVSILALNEKADKGDILFAGFTTDSGRLIGRHGSGVGDLQTITVGDGLELHGAELRTTIVPTPEACIIRIPGEIATDATASQGIWHINHTAVDQTITDVTFYLHSIPTGGGILLVNLYKSDGVDGHGTDTSAIPLYTSSVDLSTSYKKVQLPNEVTIEPGRYVTLRVHVSTALTSGGVTKLASGLTCIITYS